ncbi:hypothetical protein T265_09832 [Opisthorchis viverrini]|uniref:RNA exonuclease 4 n=1 Tax=Opisthorchis viverrini TaxID=6198 RepID=A0A074ZFE8_OPIVI|nr:hypothetical protein T265_09832 [Opisthorchis viverrini]KER21960.1 hypothetical protein T265_09832 [Opisthorchis viverrini]
MKDVNQKKNRKQKGEYAKSSASVTLSSVHKGTKHKCVPGMKGQKELKVNGQRSTKRTSSNGHQVRNQKAGVDRRGDRDGRKSSNSEIWFDGVSPSLIAASRGDQAATTNSLVKPSSFTGPTRRIAIDCEFVGVGYQGKDNALARVSIVNQFGHVLLDTFVRPLERVTDYRTEFSGVRPGDLRPDGPARPFRAVHREVAKLCKGRILVGHSIRNDLKVLMLSHPRRHIRDTSRYRPFRALFSGRTPSLRALTEKVLGVQVQVGEHDSVEDARAAMRLYTSVKRMWESKRKGPLPVVTDSAELNKSQKELHSHSEMVAKRTEILSEYESGLDPVTSSDTNTTKSVSQRARYSSGRSKAKPWDNVRNRRCSKNRERFLQKRRGRSKASRTSGFQSAAL